jgi:hypothetical protein
MMPLCEFDRAPPWICRACGRKVDLNSPRPPVRACIADPPSPRSEAEQAACMAICRTNACGAFDGIRDACRLCGCASQRREVWQSKLRIGRCPKGLWPEREIRMTNDE